MTHARTVTHYGLAKPERDATPKFLQDQGVYRSNWQAITKAQLTAFLNRDFFPAELRVWACLMLQSYGERSAYAVVFKNGKILPLGTEDIGRIVGLSRQNARRAVASLEAQGFIKREGKEDRLLKSHVRILVYATPRPPEATPARLQLPPVQKILNQLGIKLHRETAADVVTDPEISRQILAIQDDYKKTLIVVAEEYKQRVLVVMPRHAYKEPITTPIRTPIKPRTAPPIDRENSSTPQPSERANDTHSPAPQSRAAQTPPPTVKPAEWFGKFWTEYWNKKGKKTAEIAFAKAVKTENRFRVVMHAVTRDNSEMLTRPEHFRPMASTWLNAERWNDEPSPATVNAPNQSAADEVKEIWRKNIAISGNPFSTIKGKP